MKLLKLVCSCFVLVWRFIFCSSCAIPIYEYLVIFTCTYHVSKIDFASEGWGRADGGGVVDFQLQSSQARESERDLPTVWKCQVRFCVAVVPTVLCQTNN